MHDRQNRSSFVNHTPIPDQNGQNLYPFTDQNFAKTLPSEEAHIALI